MPRYRVEQIKTIYLYMEVEASSEDSALDAAIELEPRHICAQCGGWGEKWSISDDDEWQSLEEFHGSDYKPELHGQTITLIED